MARRSANQIDHRRRAFANAGLAANMVIVLLAAPATAQYANPPQQPAGGEVLTLKDCEQTDSAPLVVRACTHFLTTTKLEPTERVRILILRAVGWSKEEEYAAAADDYSAVLQHEPGNVKALEGRADARQKLGQFLAADEDYTRLIGHAPGNDGYFRSRGIARMGAHRYDEALADFDKSLALNPTEVEAYMGRAQVFNAMKDREKAKAEFDKGIAVNDRYLPLFWMRGEMAREWGDKELALESYAKVLAINSLHEDARRRMFYLGVLHPP